MLSYLTFRHIDHMMNLIIFKGWSLVIYNWGHYPLSEWCMNCLIFISGVIVI